MTQREVWITKLEKILVTTLEAKKKVEESEYIDQPVKETLIRNLDILIKNINNALVKLKALANPLPPIDWEKLSRDIEEYKG